ncbi:hypothetical protein A7K94_0204180 [Modestobacter sp. VKM Ac-2676]|nr:hypothetical protein A7K94_0204180 [Modestobacter sp. VKM Ac-2676]
MEGVTAPSNSAADLGAARAREYLQLVEAGRTEDAERLLAGLTDTRELVYVGAGFTVLARQPGARCPPRCAPRRAPGRCSSPAARPQPRRRRGAAGLAAQRRRGGPHGDPAGRGGPAAAGLRQLIPFGS